MNVESLIRDFTKGQRSFLLLYAFYRNRVKACEEAGVKGTSVTRWRSREPHFKETMELIDSNESFYQDAVAVYIRKITPDVLKQWEEIALKPWEELEFPKWKVKLQIQENILKLAEAFRPQKTIHSFEGAVRAIREEYSPLRLDVVDVEPERISEQSTIADGIFDDSGQTEQDSPA